MADLYRQAGLARAQAEIERKLAADGIRKTQTLEGENVNYIPHSTGEDYLHKARGLTHFLHYVRSYSLTRTILDIGTGTSEAIDQIARSPLGSGLHFIATALTRHPKMANFIGNIFRTSAEYLEGVKKESIGGVIAIQSIGFSKAPNIVAAKLEQVVALGGIVKATFRKKTPYSQVWEDNYNQWEYNTYDKFRDALMKYGWDVAVHSGVEGDDTQDDILVAIKHGGSRTAQEVLEADLNDYAV